MLNYSTTGFRGGHPAAGIRLHLGDMARHQIPQPALTPLRKILFDSEHIRAASLEVAFDSATPAST